MKGHLNKRGSRWSYVVDRGNDPVTGKRRQKTKGGFATKAAAQRAMREFMNDLDANASVDESRQSVEDYLTQWLQIVKSDLRPTTHSGYSRDVRNICSKVGGIRLQELTPIQIETAYADLMASGGPSGRPLNPKTIRNIHAVLRRAFSDAERLSLIGRNPVRLVRPPRVTTKEMKTWTGPQVARFLAHVADDRYLPVVVLLATTGMRRGEVFGLRWEDVHPEAGYLSVEQTLTTVEDKILIGPTKSAKSRRRIALDVETVAALGAHRKSQAAERLRCGAAWQQGQDLVFRNTDGTPTHPDRFTYWFKRRVSELDLPAIGPHGLRHTWATLALQAGVHPKVVSSRLGHSTIAITLDTYSHVTPGLDEDAASLVATRIFESA